ncbi:MAG: hypothetical protein LCH61_18485 [Proteobacteria bacterium]|nr:hypothetical protein [Pseudomonadota bacterium]
MRALSILFALALAGAAQAQSRRAAETKKPDPMTFRLVASNPVAPPEMQNRWVVAKGQILADTPKAFGAFLKDHDISGLTIYFDSVGGSILGGIRLGEALRKINARVSIGRSSELDEGKDGALPRYQLAPNLGQCYSSCAYAFLGGRFRASPIGAQFGVHMFWPGDKIDGIYDRNYRYEEIERAQRVSAEIAAYMQTMGVDLQLLNLAARTPPKGVIRRLTPREITDLRVAAITTGTPVFALPRGWGILTYASTANLTTGGTAEIAEGMAVRYVLDLQCGASPEFDQARFDISLVDRPPPGKVLGMNRVMLVAGDEDGVLTWADKDIHARPDPFNRLLTLDANRWLSKSGLIPASVSANAIRTGLSVRIFDPVSGHPPHNIELPKAGYPEQYRLWSRACEKFRKVRPEPARLDY